MTVAGNRSVGSGIRVAGGGFERSRTDQKICEEPGENQVSHGTGQNKGTDRVVEVAVNPEDAHAGLAHCRNENQSVVLTRVPGHEEIAQSEKGDGNPDDLMVDASPGCLEGVR